MNTVHVHDVARALWHLCYHGNSGDIYNLADQGDTSNLMHGYCVCVCMCVCIFSVFVSNSYLRIILE